MFQSLGLTSLNKLRDSLEKSKSKSREKEKNLSREKYKIPKFILEKKRNQSFYEKRWSPKKELRTSFNQQKKLSKF